MAEPLGAGQAVPGEGRRPPPQVVRAHHVPLPLRRPPHRPLVRHGPRGRPLPLPPDAGLQRPAPNGLRRLWPAGGERRHTPGHPPLPVDHEQHRKHAKAAELNGSRLRLGPGDNLRPAGVLPVEPVDIPPVLQGGAGLPRQRARQLVPLLPDRACQRAGGRRQVRAVRLARQPPRPGAVVLRHHQVRRGAPGLLRTPGLARQDQGHADQLDRPQRGRGDQLRHIGVRVGGG